MTSGYIPAPLRRRLRAEGGHWGRDSVEIIGVTACGRVTTIALRLNSEELVAARHVWVATGLHPRFE
ncbi:MAG: hypothetical protein HY784_19215 [Chloroflexi bacterium]|nr:hypothetical protein [Chloroflexota bacterium]